MIKFKHYESDCEAIEKACDNYRDCFGCGGCPLDDTAYCGNDIGQYVDEAIKLLNGVDNALKRLGDKYEAMDRERADKWATDLS